MSAAMTPGPWSTQHGARVYDDATGMMVADCSGGNFSRSAEMKHARAIAALPDLIEACKAALSLAWEAGSESEDGVKTLLEDGRGDLYRQLSAALAKAGA